LSELLVLGAEVKLAQLEEDEKDAVRRLELRKRFLDRTRRVKGLDLDAALEVRKRGWTHE
jgi:hypothetical protein